MLSALILSACNGSSGGNPAGEGQIHFVPNSFAFWNDPRFATTKLPPNCTGPGPNCMPVPCRGPDCVPVPAYADILLEPSNFVECQGGPFALCYYSGPNSGGVDLSCMLTGDGFADCNCYEISYGKYFVDMNAILNYAVYLETVRTCGPDGRKCFHQPNLAPVCGAINNGQLIPGADVVSTFSFDCAATNKIGQTNCPQPPGKAPYAGCMTAPCKRLPGHPGIVRCSCPVFDGPFQTGETLNPPVTPSCNLGGDLVWSAAFNPGAAGATFPEPDGGCFPDAPQPFGCALLPPAPPPYVPPPGANCAKVCEEYSDCHNSQGVGAGFTCDATLCTSQCNDQALVNQACSGLSTMKCDLTEIARVEELAQCSCCASQLCGCVPNSQTEVTIFGLDQAQRRAKVKPQCDINGTLCGTPPPS